MRLALLIVPAVFVGLAIWFMSLFPLSPARVAETRRLLDARREEQFSTPPSSPTQP
jgi:hypothetical protein